MAAGDISKAMLASVRRRIGEPAAADRSDDDIYAWMNEGQLDLVARQLPDVALLPFTEVYNGVWSTGVYDYTLPVDFLRERFIEVNGYPAKRVQLLDLDAITANTYWAASKTKPKYAMVDGGIRFYTGSADPDSLVWKAYYVRKPMWVRALSSAVRATNVVTLTFAAAHGLTADNVGESIVVEGVTPTGATNFNGTFTIASVPLTTTVTYAQTAGNDTGSGGRCVNTALGQISTGEDPLMPAIFRGLIMDWATSRSREQVRQFDEATRQANHYQQRVEAAKARYHAARPHDAITGDPGRLQAQ